MKMNIGRIGHIGLAAAAMVACSLPARAWNTVRTDQDFTGYAQFEQATTFKGPVLVGATDITGALTALGTPAQRVQPLTVTNGAAVTLVANSTVVLLTSVGSANGATNLVSLATPYPAPGESYTIVLAPGGTNAVLFADASTNLALGANVVLNPNGDTLRVLTLTTNVAVKVSSSAN